MANSIAWEKDLDKALERARRQKMPILLFFHNPNCPGCQQMDAVTYPDKKELDFLQKNYIPLQIPFDAKPLSQDFNVKWTPTLITLGADMREHHRTVGFLDPDGFIASFLLGIGKYNFDNERYPEALTFFERVIAEKPQSDSVAEAIYLRGVSRYKNSGDRKPLKEIYEILSSRFPDSEWTGKAYPYRLL